MIAVAVVVAATVLLGWALGEWMFRALLGPPTPLEPGFLAVEGLVYRALGVEPAAPMGWRAWVRVVVVADTVLFAALYAVFLAQGALPLNPDGVGGMSWDLALHTASSFVTNTNQQHYSGQAQLTYLAQLAAVVTAQFVTPAIGLAAMLATVRGLAGGAPGGRRDAWGDVDLGNAWADVVRGLTRVLVPLSTVLAALLTWQGVPATLAGALRATPLDPATAEQVVPVGPVSAMVAIKQLGTNGGGWYGPNSAVPLENPTPLSNVFELVAILLVPVACAVVAAKVLGRPFGRLTFVSMGAVAVALAAPILWLESGDNPALRGLAAIGPNWEGKEVRIGVETSALWAAATTLTSNGSVNAMHDSLLPLSGLVPFAGMFVNAAFGGVGVGVLNFLLYVLLAVFVAGLLVGRTPELFHRKVEVAEIRLVSLAVLLPCVAVLVPAAMAFAWGLEGTSNPGPHGVSQVLYEYASAAANNGSGFEGLGDNTPWWNVSCSVVLLACRFVPMLAPVAVAGLLARKRPTPVSAGTLPIGGLAMVATVLSVMIILQLLTFVPALVLGPVAEHLVAAPALAGPR
jgi:K+-transporting ATPase ATPase A chain